MSKKKDSKPTNFFVRKQNDLFKSDIDWQNNACLNVTHDNWFAYIEGYKQAADIIVNHVGETHRSQDFLVYPTVFLYRQYIELLLKKIIIDGSHLLDKDAKITESHYLDKLWVRCRKIIEEVWPDGDKQVLDRIEQSILNFVNVDPSSTSFRYPIDKNDNPSLPGIRHINLRNLSDMIKSTTTDLEGVYFCISGYLDNKHEIESYYTDYNDYY